MTVRPMTDLNKRRLAAAAIGVTAAWVVDLPRGEAREQVITISQFSDLQATDWAYQALSQLIERYGCLAGYPNGRVRGGEAISRYEAAALLNACLDRVSAVSDELKKLLGEFELELAVLRGRVDALDAQVGQLEAMQFATTTRLNADTRWVLGGQTFGGNQVASNNTDALTGTPLRNGLSFNYDIRLNFDTSFTGKDLLRAQLRSGNFRDSAFGAEPTLLSRLDAGFQEDLGNADGGDVVAINKLLYKTPLSQRITVVGGPLVRQDDLLAVWPSAYRGDKILKIFQYAGSPVANSQLSGVGAGLWWKRRSWSLSANYLSANGDKGNPGEGGLANGNSVGSGSLQLAYSGDGWNISGLYTHNNRGVRIAGTPLAAAAVREAYSGTNAFNLAGYWQPSRGGWIPSISAGWGIANSSNVGGSASSSTGVSLTTQSWMVGLNWKDAVLPGNVLGMAVGQPTFVTGGSRGGNTADGNYAWEWFYRFQVTDNIAVTPAIFWLSRPQGELTGQGNTFNSFGYLLQTTFRF